MESAGFIAHVRFDGAGVPIEHWLEEHLHKVSKRAGGYAEAFSSAEIAALAGIWHDLGKFNPEFQSYIGDKTGYTDYKRRALENAHVETQPGKVDHSTAGAIYAVEKLGIIGRILAYLIAGHHAGLPDWHDDEGSGKPLKERIANKEHLSKALASPIPPSILTPPITPSIPDFVRETANFALWVRMLFSTLVDADFLDTESFMNEAKAAKRGQYQSLNELQQKFNRHMDGLLNKARQKPSEVNQIRADILEQCRAAAEKPVGLFSLSVPTGGGKTLSSMAFALDHAIKHKMRRVIYVIPYTSIIEQTAEIFRGIFGDDNVLEHHSSTEPDKEEKEDSLSRLAAENWDAPIIVTTSVQYFESLFAARTSRCRKLHNIVNSVVVLDETQLLPAEHLDPILQVMRQLSHHYKVTQVLSTATQPALKADRFEPVTGHLTCKGLGETTEIISNPDALYQQLERVRIRLPEDFTTPTDWETLSEDIDQYERVLVIVNRRQDARDLHALMPEDTYHLSALMCAQHRSLVIDEIKEKLLKTDQPVRVVSTQLVEAGVDMDFPVVYRAMAGLDSIAQAAGRCNREGRLSDKGEVVVFVPPKPSRGLLGKAAESAVSLLTEYSGQTLESVSPAMFTRYFDAFYGRLNSLDKAGINELLRPAGDLSDCQFKTAALKFQMIEEGDTFTVFVKFDNQSSALIDKLETMGPERWLMRKLQRYTVTLYGYQFRPLLDSQNIREVWAGIYAQNTDTLYDPLLGLKLSEEAPSVNDLYF